MEHVEGPDKRKWRKVVAAKECEVCGAIPIAARTASGWELHCPTDYHHGYHFEQWLSKCVRKWNIHNARVTQ